jgi:NADH dehydrogenase
MKKVIIVGGGFAGLNLAKRLCHNNHFDITVVDKNNYHFFPPLLYQVATAFIEPSNISYPFRKLLQRHKNVRFFMGELTSVKPAQNMIDTTNGFLSYDYLVLAMGTEVNYFGNENIKRNALSMKTIDDALMIRNHILMKMEEAVRAASHQDKTRLTNIVIAGGGPTGVELAGMMAEMARSIVAKEYPEAEFPHGTIYLVDSAQLPLGPMSKAAQHEAYQVLTNLGVKILNGTLVKDFIENQVILSNGNTIPTETLLWCSGVIVRKVAGLSDDVFTKGNRIIVDEFNEVQGYDNIFAIGDLCFQNTDTTYPQGHPQVAQVAIQQGEALAHNLIRLSEGKTLKPFTYRDYGKMAIISKYKAIVDMKGVTVKGFTAWLMWLFIHLMPLVSFRNRVKVLLNWALSFFTNDAALRLIIRPDQKRFVNTEKLSERSERAIPMEV